MAKDDKKILEQIALDVASQLSDIASMYNIKPIKSRTVRSLQIWSMNTGGWSAHVGRLGPQGPAMEVWFDRWTAGRSRRFYAGLSASTPTIQRVLNLVPSKLTPAVRFTPKDVEWAASSRLKGGLPKYHFGTPVLENFYGSAFFGLYFDRPPTTARARSLIAEDSIRFFLQIADACAREEAGVYEGLEQRILRTHLRFERSSKAAKLCKVRDRYQCRVCGFSFERTYGAIGRDFAEAHHVVPLSELGDINICRASDLITVCANCHRMLHRVQDGQLVDWKTLRKRVRSKPKAAA